MSTYTDICNKVKETLVVDYHTRITPQQVNFINPKNSFTGEIHAVGDNSITGAKLTDVEISESILKNSVLDNVTFKSGLNIDTVLQAVDGISAKVEDLDVRLNEKVDSLESDLSTNVDELHEDDAILSTAIEFERINRKNADESLSSDIMHEISYQEEQSKFRDLELNERIDEEISNRISSESELEDYLKNLILHDRHFELHLIDTSRFPIELKDFAVNTVIDTVPDAYVYESNQITNPIAKIENARYDVDGNVSAFTLNAFADKLNTFELTGAGKLQYEFNKDLTVQYTGVGGYRLSYDAQAGQGLNDMHFILNSASKNGFYHVNLDETMVGKVAWNGYNDPKIVDGKIMSCNMTIQSELLPAFSRIIPYALQNGITYDAGNDRTITLSDNVAILDDGHDVRYLPLLATSSNDAEFIEFGKIYEGNIFAKDGILNALVVEFNGKSYTLYRDRNFSEFTDKLDPYKSITYLEDLNRVKVESTRKYYEYKFNLDQGTLIPGYSNSWNKTIDSEYDLARVNLNISSSLLDKYVNKQYDLKTISIANVLECNEELYDDESKLIGTIELKYFKLQHQLKLRISKLDLTDVVSMTISINDESIPTVIDLSLVEWYSNKICLNILDVREDEYSIDHIVGKKYYLDIDITKVDYRGESKVLQFNAKVEDDEGRKVINCVDVKLPYKHSIPVNPFDVSRHFILNAKFYGKSLQDDKFITLNIISNHHEDRFYYAGKSVNKIFMLLNKFSTLEFTEIRPHRFIINDLDNSEIDWRIEWLHERLSTDEISVAAEISELSTDVVELSSEISTAIQRNRDDVSFFGDVLLSDRYNEHDIHNHLSDLVATNDDTKGKVQYGFMYRCKAPIGRETEQFGIWIDGTLLSAYLKDNMYFIINRKFENDTIPLDELKYQDVAFFNNFDIDVANLSAYAKAIELSASEISSEVNRLCNEISTDVVDKYNDRMLVDNYISARVNILCTAISDDIVSKHKDLTSTVSSLCSTVTTDFVNRLSANDILGFNKFIGDVSAANVSVENETIRTLSAGNVEFTNLTVHGELVAKDLKTDAIIAHLSSASADIDIANVLTANLDTVNATDATIGSLSIDSSNLLLTDRLSTLNEELSDLEAKTDFLLSVGHRSMEYFNDVRSIKYVSHVNADLSDWIKDNFNTIPELSGGLKQGFMFRLSAEQKLYAPGASDPYIVLNANDYFIVKHDIRPLDRAKLEDFAIIYDAEAEGKSLCTDLSIRIDLLDLSVSKVSNEVDILTTKYDLLSTETDRLCSEISDDIVAKYDWLSTEVKSNYSDIKYLSSELSDYHNTLSGIDRQNHEYEKHISSDNLIVTDLNATPEGIHSRYYMTIDYGTIVMRKI